MLFFWVPYNKGTELLLFILIFPTVFISNLHENVNNFYENSFKFYKTWWIWVSDNDGSITCKIKKNEFEICKIKFASTKMSVYC